MRSSFTIFALWLLTVVVALAAWPAATAQAVNEPANVPDPNPPPPPNDAPAVDNDPPNAAPAVDNNNENQPNADANGDQPNAQPAVELTPQQRLALVMVQPYTIISYVRIVQEFMFLQSLSPLNIDTTSLCNFCFVH